MEAVDWKPQHVEDFPWEREKEGADSARHQIAAIDRSNRPLQTAIFFEGMRVTSISVPYKIYTFLNIYLSDFMHSICVWKPNFLAR